MFAFFKQRQRIPVLCYHSMNADTLDYLGNDHLALEQDLATLEKLGYRLIDGMTVVDFVLGKKRFSQREKVACISIDDASILDYDSYQSPKIGTVKSFRHIFLDSPIFQRSQSTILNFAIVDEAVRHELDSACMQGRGDWQSDWWEKAIDSKLYDMANHSLDHMHGALQKTVHSRGEKGNFYAVDNYLDADRQIRQAYENLQNLVNRKATPLFGYPYGHVSDYLQKDYFPNYQQEHRQYGAFTTAGEYATQNSDRWAIPRFVCGEHWKSPVEFEAILRGI